MSDPILKRGATRTVIGIEVSDLNVSMLGNSDTLVANVPLAAFAMNGGFDGAYLKLERAFARQWGNEACGTLNMFEGRVADVQVTGTEVDITVKSLVELLNVPMPHNVFMASCLHTLYDGGCTLNASAFTFSGTIDAASTDRLLKTSMTQADDYFALGTLKMTSGRNAGVTRGVKAYANTDGFFTLGFRFPYPPEIGDTFEAKPGCDKSMATCNSAKFNNLVNFRGFPFIPVPETTL